MAVRNFWVDVDIEGRKTMLSDGPHGKADGMRVTIYQRDEGCMRTAADIICRADGDKLITQIDWGGLTIGRFETTR